MEETFSDDFKRLFLIKFTEELIKHSATKDITKLKSIIELKEKRRIEKLIQKKRGQFIPEQGAAEEKQEIKKEELAVGGKVKPQPLVKPAVMQMTRPPLLIAEPKLPPHLEYLKPVPATTANIDLLKLNPIMKDPSVRMIEGNPDEKIKVTGTMGTKETDIVLNKEEINQIINKFSELSKIPLSEGVYRVAVGNLVLSAIISEVIGSKFVIKKVIAPPVTRQPYSSMNNRAPVGRQIPPPSRQRFPAIPTPPGNRLR